MKLLFFALAALIAASCAIPIGNFPSSNNLQLAYQTLDVSRVEQTRRERPEERNFEGIEYRLRPTQQYDEDFQQEVVRRVNPGATTTHIQALVGNDDNTQLVRSGGSFVLGDPAHIQELLRSQLERRQQQQQQLQLQQLQLQHQAQLSRARLSQPREEELPAGRRGPLYALVQDEEFQHPTAFQRSRPDASEEQVRIDASQEHARQQQAQIISNDNFQRQRAQQVRNFEEDEYSQPQRIQAVEEQNVDHVRALAHHLNTRRLSRPSAEQSQQAEQEYVAHLISTGQTHRFGNAESQRRQEQEEREQHEQQVQRQLLLQQQLHEHHRQQALHLIELERREKARKPNKIETVDEQRSLFSVAPTQIANAALRNDVVQQEQAHSGPRFALVGYEKSENRGRGERVFPISEEERLGQQRPIRIKQQVSSNPTQDRRVPVNAVSISAVPSVTAEVAQATADHFNFYNSVAKNLPVLSLEETDPEAAAILKARHGARLHHDGILVIDEE